MDDLPSSSDLLFVVKERNNFQLRSFGLDSAASSVLVDNLPVTEDTAYAQVGKYFVMVGAYGWKNSTEVLKDVEIYDMSSKQFISNPPPLLAPKCLPILVPLGSKLFAFSTIVAHCIKSRLESDPRFEVLDTRDLSRRWIAISSPRTPPIPDDAGLYVIIATTSCTSTSSIYLSLGTYYADYRGRCSLMYSDSTKKWLTCRDPLPFIGTAMCHDDIFFGFPAHEQRYFKEVCSYRIDDSKPGTFRFVGLCSFPINVLPGLTWRPYMMTLLPKVDNTICLIHAWFEGSDEDVPNKHDHVLVLSKISLENEKAVGKEKGEEKAIGVEVENEKTVGEENAMGVDLENKKVLGHKKGVEKAMGVDVENEEVLGPKKGKDKALGVELVKAVGGKKKKQELMAKDCEEEVKEEEEEELDEIVTKKYKNVSWQKIEKIVQETERMCMDRMYKNLRALDEAHCSLKDIEALKIPNMLTAILWRRNQRVVSEMTREAETILHRKHEALMKAPKKVGSIMQRASLKLMEVERKLKKLELELGEDEVEDEGVEDEDEDDGEDDDEEEEVVDVQLEKSIELVFLPGVMQLSGNETYKLKGKIHAFVGESQGNGVALS